MKTILSVFGTRPEAIKMAPLVKEIKKSQSLNSLVCVTGQHREMLDQVLDLFELKPDYDLNIMTPGQSLNTVSSKILTGLEPVLDKLKPDYVLVHGDTATTFATALAAYYKKIPVGHIEAGLRTQNIYSPWPEEANRKLTGVLSNIHFAPTKVAKDNLIKEGYAENSIYVTGNTVIDALLLIKAKLEKDRKLNDVLNKQFDFLDQSKRLILVTGHRRENFGEGFKNICDAIKTISKNDNVQVIYPVHLNPNVQKPVNQLLSNLENVFLIEPQDYLPFVYLMMRSYLILTDSGGIQEEAPALGKPVLVMRDTTERPEAVAAGTVKLVGTSSKLIEDSISQLLSDKTLYSNMSKAQNPYGDGNASKKIVKILTV